MQSTAVLPLAGIRVLDFSNLLPGPLASLLLVEAGADVIKVERPGVGDEMRGYEPAWAGASGNFALLNRGKTSLCADLKHDGDRAHVRELARTADVVIEQFRPGVMARLGFGYEALCADNPALIYCSITGYGQTGERARKAGHDLTYMAETGILGLSRADDGAPALPQVLAADIGAGAYPAVINILLALQQRARTGRGCHIDVAMCDNLFTFAYWGLSAGLAGGRWPRPGGELTTGGSPRYRIYRTADGEYLAAAPIEERFWKTFCDGIGLAEADRDDASDPASTIRKVAERIAARTAAEWRQRFAGTDACIAVVESLEQAFADPGFSGRGLFDRVVRARSFVMPALPVPIVDGLRDPSRARPFPDLDPVNRRKQWTGVRSRAPRPYDLSGMRILLTGASSRIVQATARLCAELGADLVLADRLPVPDLPEASSVGGGKHVFLVFNPGSRREIERLCDAVGDIDAAVLDVAVLPGSGPDDDAWDDGLECTLDVNVHASVHLALELIRAMKVRGRGRLVLTASDTAGIGEGCTNSPPQGAGSMSALHTMVRSLARRAAPEVPVNGLALASGKMPVTRLTRPEEIAWPIAFLCSPGASLVRGAVLDVSGGSCIP